MIIRLKCVHSFLALLFIIATATGSVPVDDSTNVLPSQPTETSKLFREIEEGIVSGKYERFGGFFERQVSINLRQNESGSFSSSQAYYVVKDFFERHRLVSFKLTTSDETGETAYATGGGVFVSGGKKIFLQVYIGLTKRAGKWAISQFNVY